MCSLIALECDLRSVHSTHNTLACECELVGGWHCTSTCYHIMAAKLSICQDDEITPKKKIKLSQHQKSARSRKENTSGRKRP